MTRRDDERSELSRFLVTLRTSASLTQVEVAARTAITQSQLSRVERGRALPTVEEVATLAELYGASAQQRRELTEMATAARAGVRDIRLVVQRGMTLAMQQRWCRMESDATVVQSYHPAIVLGVLQVPAYAAVVFGQPADSEQVRERSARLDTMLESSRRYVLVQTEGSLRFRVGSDAVMAEQLKAIIDVLDRPNLQLGVIPASRALTTKITPVGFHIYDDTVVVSLEVAAATLTEPDDVQHFQDLFHRMSDAAVFGTEARELLTRIAEDYR